MKGVAQHKKNTGIKNQALGKIFAHRHYALLLLTLVYGLSVVDRQILSILLQPIKDDLYLSDTQLGFLSGFAFAIFYATMGIPIARLADKFSRRKIIAISLAVFSGMTAVCGLAGNFWHMMLARIGVGIGEAGTSPASHSIIADLYPSEQRSTAMATLTVGANIAVVIGIFGGALVAQTYGWRIAFYIVGLPGIALALLVYLTLKEPVRGFADGTFVQSPQRASPTVYEVLSFLLTQKAYVHIAAGTGLFLFGGLGIGTWMPSFFARSHGMSTAEVGTIMSLLSILTIFGTLLGGVLADYLGRRDKRWILGIVAISALIIAPFMMAVIMLQSSFWAICLYTVPALLNSFFQGPALAMTQALAPLRMRAVASAILLFVANIIGMGLGPQFVGILSDSLHEQYGDESLRYALLAVTPILFWAAAHFYWATKSLKEGIARVADINAAELK